ncbi:MAG: class I SAM-dependent methyltransferase [Calditrichia bacterium]
MTPRLHTRNINGTEDILVHFNRLAMHYSEQHGNADRLLNYRLKLLREAGAFNSEMRLLDIGCGPGTHLLPLAPFIKEGTGIDISPEMIRIARQQFRHSPHSGKIRLLVNRAEVMEDLYDAYFDVCICTGALEHIPDQPAVLKQAFRVLKPGGRLLILTPNADFIWYSKLAGLLKYATRHLSTDRFIGKREGRDLLQRAGFLPEIRYWRFIPSGDMTRTANVFCKVAQFTGRALKWSVLQGGLLLTGTKPAQFSSVPLAHHHLVAEQVADV